MAVARHRAHTGHKQGIVLPVWFNEIQAIQNRIDEERDEMGRMTPTPPDCDSDYIGKPHTPQHQIQNPPTINRCKW